MDGQCIPSETTNSNQQQQQQQLTNQPATSNNDSELTDSSKKERSGASHSIHKVAKKRPEQSTIRPRNNVTSLFLVRFND
jgi:hypothetical protein